MIGSVTFCGSIWSPKKLRPIALANSLCRWPCMGRVLKLDWLKTATTPLSNEFVPLLLPPYFPSCRDIDVRPQKERVSVASNRPQQTLRPRRRTLFIILYYKPLRLCDALCGEAKTTLAPEESSRATYMSSLALPPVSPRPHFASVTLTSVLQCRMRACNSSFNNVD